MNLLLGKGKEVPGPGHIGLEHHPCFYGCVTRCIWWHWSNQNYINELQDCKTWHGHHHNLLKVWSVSIYKQDSLDQCSMPINADQNADIDPEFLSIPINWEELIAIDQNWSALGLVPQFWSALGIDRGSPV